MMHRHKYLAVALAAGLAIAGSATAQTGEATRPSAPADSGRRMMDPISRLLEQRQQLALTDDQARQLEAIRTKYREKHKDHFERLRREREARSAFRASMDSARAEVAAVLTPEQEKQVEAMREEWRREWRKAHKDRHHGGGRGRHHDHGEGEDSRDS